ncbi:hypothetical protein GPECTOR_57g490 [Gonium pectorale]|uniref:RWD domain-containing protein n=1 Tax=Gonium pectorale TaxID=33097 RepID=A0A150G783_GONPE|nr:hypothetical protein GPECTOR_57g490 [Gonium pectorale]|eukprot:KXZ45200.1 hypothetical protein GPECTOR_57g490 [Gonium pectorale]
MNGAHASDADAVARDEELCALEAIYGEAVHVSREESLVEVCVAHPSGAASQEVILRVSLPPDYPSASAPVAELYGGHLSDDVLQWAARQLESQFAPGEVALYNWVEWLKEQELLWSAPAGPQQQQQQQQRGGGGGGGDGAEGGGGGTSSRRAAAAKEAVREAEALELLRSLRVTSGEPYVEKKSTFQAHVAPVHSFEEVAAVMDALLSISKIRAATHNIMAYRIHNPAAGAGAGAGAGGGSGGSFLQAAGNAGAVTGKIGRV